MANFCKYCGRPLADGEVCNCTERRQRQPQRQNQPQSQQQNQGQQQAQPQSQQQNQGQQQAQPQNQSQQQAQPQSQSQQQAQPQWQQNQGQQQAQPQWQQNQGQQQAQPQWQQQNQNSNQQKQNQWSDWAKNPSSSVPYGDAGSLWASMKERMGIGEPEYNTLSPYEDGLKIIPDIVSPNEGEVPIRQYKVATFRNKIAGITYAKATGRIQVTNKRIVFRAPGKSIIGTRTSLQHEFLIDEIGGIEARREHIFNKGDMCLGILAAVLGTFVMGRIVGNSAGDVYQGLGAACYFLALFFGVIGILPFFAVKKLWLFKAFLAGISGGAFIVPAILGGNGFFAILAFMSDIIAFIAALLYAIRPNLVLSVKLKGAASTAVDIRRTSTGIGGILQRAGGSDSDDHTGFKEVYPEEDAEKAIREIGAMINDIQKLGDYAVSKWQK